MGTFILEKIRFKKQLLSGIKKNENPNIQLHLIGKLQTNKVKHAVKLFDYIHSVDNLKLAKKFLMNKKN